MQVVILCGGQGTRLGGLADGKPKCLVPVAGSSVLARQLELVRRHGFRDVLLLTGYRSEQIERCFGDGSALGLRIAYRRERVPLGTAGALRAARDSLRDEFVVMYGDTVLDVDLSALAATRRQARAAAALFVHPNEHPHDSDLVGVDAAGNIVAFYPKPRPAREWRRNLVSAALYAMTPHLLDFVEGPEDFGRDVFPRAIRAGQRLVAHASDEYIKDMGTPARLCRVERDVGLGLVRQAPGRRVGVLLDRDGTINRDVGLVSRAEQLELEPGAAEAIRSFNQRGLAVVVVTNQSVIARNLCDFEELERIHAKLETLLGLEGAYLDGIYVCPHHPDRGYPEEAVAYKVACECRKPRPGLLLRAAAAHRLDLRSSYLVGDRLEDMLVAQNAEVPQRLLVGRSPPPAATSLATHVCESLREAGPWICDDHASRARAKPGCA